MHEGYVYFVEAIGTGRIKIGFTQGDIRNRLGQLATGSATELNLLGFQKGPIGLESELHVRFSHVRLKGEWFSGSEELRGYIRSNAMSLEDDGCSESHHHRESKPIKVSFWASQTTKDRLTRLGQQWGPVVSLSISEVIAEALRRSDTEHGEFHALSRSDPDQPSRV